MTKREPFTTDQLFCPGPTPVPESVRASLTETSIYHRSQEFYKAFQQASSGLKPIFGSQEDPLILACSGSGAMDAAVNRLTTGERVVVVNGGKFGERWTKINRIYGNEVTEVSVPWGQAPSAELIIAALGTQESGNVAQALFIQANETSTGAYYDIERLVPNIRKSYQGLIVVDCISSLGAHPMRMEEWGIDCVVAGSQKGFGLPPGLAFIALSDRAWAVENSRPRFYFDLDAERKGQAKGRSAFTPAINLVLGLNTALEQIHTMGVPEWNKHHQRLADATRAGVKAMGLELLAAANPSNALTAIRLPDQVDGNLLIEKSRSRYGAFFAGGQDQLKGKVVRIAHLGFVSVFEIVAAMACFEWTLHACGGMNRPGLGTQAVVDHLK